MGETILSDEYATIEDLCAALGVTRRTLDRWHAMRAGPPRTVIGRTILYRRQAIKRWLLDREEELGCARTRGSRGSTGALRA
jgi:predicted DNA-binding transcriptional regulator AlpA